MTDKEKSFIYWADEWSSKYRFKIGEGIRYFPFKIALNLFLQRGGQTIVETGTTRATDDFGGAGMATIFLGDFCQQFGKKLYTVDILPSAIDLSKMLTSEYQDVITYVTDDSLHFLQEFPEKIDFLYLDSLDCPTENDPKNPALIASQNHQLKEFIVAEKLLHDDSIVLLDDNGHLNGGKCKLTKEYLIQRGWECILDDYQSIWQK